jgi:hypothetical protein
MLSNVGLFVTGYLGKRRNSECRRSRAKVEKAKVKREKKKGEKQSVLHAELVRFSRF